MGSRTTRQPLNSSAGEELASPLDGGLAVIDSDVVHRLGGRRYAESGPMTPLLRCSCVLVTLGLVVSGSSELRGQTARIEGRVLDEVTGLPVPNARVHILKTTH